MAGMMGPGQAGPPAGGGVGFIPPRDGGPQPGTPGGQMSGPGGPYGAQPGYGPPGGAGTTGGQAPLLPSNANDIAAIEKKIQWQLLFFVGACCAVVAGVISVVHFILTLLQVSEWSPFTFVSCVFLIFFGGLMIVLDFPMSKPGQQLITTREHIFRFALFLTRFTGRGMWYMFLGTHTWVALFDDNIHQILAFFFTLYLVILGFAAFLKGFLLSRKLQVVRAKVLDSQVRPESYMTDVRMGMTRQQFETLVNNMVGPGYFTDSEFGYVLNALSFSHKHQDESLSLDEYQYWLLEGPMMWV